VTKKAGKYIYLKALGLLELQIQLKSISY